MPARFTEIDRFARRAYVVTEVDGVLNGARLQRAEQRVKEQQ
ncbi:hypothetical protein [Microbacterium sp. A84]